MLYLSNRTVNLLQSRRRTYVTFLSNQLLGKLSSPIIPRCFPATQDLNLVPQSLYSNPATLRPAYRHSLYTPSTILKEDYAHTHGSPSTHAALLASKRSFAHLPIMNRTLLHLDSSNEKQVKNAQVNTFAHPYSSSQEISASGTTPTSSKEEAIRHSTSSPPTHLPYEAPVLLHTTRQPVNKGEDSLGIGQNTFRFFARQGLRLSQLFESNLLLANCIVATVLFVVADLLCQMFEDASKAGAWTIERLDYYRTLRLALFAFIINGPFYTWWYGHVIKSYVAARPPTFYYKAFIPTLVDTFILGPIFIVFFHYAISKMAGDIWVATKQKLKEDIPRVVLIDFVAWPPIQLCNFMFVPAKFQAAIVCVADFFWAVFLSWSSSNKRKRSEYMEKLVEKQV